MTSPNGRMDNNNKHNLQNNNRIILSSKFYQNQNNKFYNLYKSEDQNVCVFIGKNVFQIICLKCRYSPVIKDPFKKIRWSDLERYHQNCDVRLIGINNVLKKSLSTLDPTCIENGTKKMLVFEGTSNNPTKFWMCRICQNEVYKTVKKPRTRCFCGNDDSNMDLIAVFKSRGVLFDNNENICCSLSYNKMGNKRKQACFVYEQMKKTRTYIEDGKKGENLKQLLQDFNSHDLDIFFSSNFIASDENEIYQEASTFLSRYISNESGIDSFEITSSVSDNLKYSNDQKKVCVEWFREMMINFHKFQGEYKTKLLLLSFDSDNEIISQARHAVNLKLQKSSTTKEFVGLLLPLLKIFEIDEDKQFSFLSKEQKKLYVEEEILNSDGNFEVIYKINEEFLHQIYMKEVKMADLQNSVIFKFLTYKQIMCYKNFSTRNNNSIYNQLYKIGLAIKMFFIALGTYEIYMLGYGQNYRFQIGKEKYLEELFGLHKV